MTMTRTRSWVAVCLACIGTVGLAEDFVSFRGSRGDGSSQETDAPVRWSADQGIAWSAALPQGGNGSPIVVGDQVFVTSAEDADGRTRSLLAFDAKTGDLNWKKSVQLGRKMPTHKTNPYAGSTPVSDGTHVVVWHGSAGLFAYDMQGTEIWSVELGDFKHMWGYGSSPVITGDRVILHTGPGERVFVLGIDLASGDEIWRHEEPVDGNGERNSNDNYMGSWSTPVLMDHHGKTIAVCALATRVCGFDVDTGDVAWFCEGIAGQRGDLAYSSPMIENDLCVMFGGFKGPAIAFPVRGSGDITSSRLWRTTDRNPQNIGTGYLLDGYAYRLGAGPNTIDCLNAKTGEVVWQQRVASRPFWGSIVYNGKHAYATDQSGTTYVFQLSPDGYQEVAKNELGDTCNATPALAGGRIYIRTYQKLWCIDGA